MCYINQAKLKLDLDVAEEMLRRAEPQNDPMSRLVAHRVMAVTQNIMARFTSAREHAEQAAALFEQVKRLRDPAEMRAALCNATGAGASAPETPEAA